MDGGRYRRLAGRGDGPDRVSIDGEGVKRIRQMALEPVTISLAVGGKSYQASGQGECHYAPIASYRDMRAAMWSVEYSSESKDGLTNLTSRPGVHWGEARTRCRFP